MRRRGFLALGAGALASAAPPGRARAAGPRRGGTLKQIGVEPSSFDVHAGAAAETAELCSIVHRTLFRFVHGAGHDPSDFTLVPDLARRAEVSRDGRAYTIALRPGVRWERRAPVHGRAFTSADVKYSLERVQRRSPYAGLLGPVEAVETPDPLTVRVHLSVPHAPFLHNLAEPWIAMLPREVEDRFGGFASPRSLVGCGPFVLERYEPGIKAVFARNPDHPAAGPPYVDRVEWLFIRDDATRLSLFRAGQVDLPCEGAGIPRAEVAALRRSRPGYPVRYWDGLAVRSLAFRTDRAPFSDVRVRRAFSLAVDRATWVRRDLAGQGVEDHGPVPAPLKAWKLPARDYGEGARWLAHDPALARRLLAEAGFPSGMRVRCTHWPGHGPDHVEDLRRLAAALREVGVELQIVDEEHGDHVRGSLRGRFEETTWGPSAALTEVDGYLYDAFRTGQPGNRSHVADPWLDEMLDAQRRALSRPERKRIVDAIQRHVTDRVYYVYTPVPRRVASWAPRVRNYRPKNSLDRGAQLEGVWLG